MRRYLDRLYTGSGALAAVCLASICALMLVQAAGREFGLLIRGGDDITSWLCAASAFFALGHTFRHGELVRVGLFVDMLNPARRRIAEILALSVTAIFVAYMAWAVTKFVYQSWQFNEVAQGLIKLPIWIPQMSFVLGVLIFFIAVIDELILVIKNQKPSYQLAEEERLAKGDFSEMV